MSKKGLLIALLKSDCSFAELNKISSNNARIEKFIKCLHDMINDHKAIGEWKIQLAIQTSFISSIDSGEIHIVRSWSDNIEIMMDSKTDDIINELTDCLLQDGISRRTSINE